MFALGLLLAFGCQQQPSPPSEDTGEPLRLTVGDEMGREMRRSEVHRYRIASEAGEYLHFAVEQQGVDLTVVLFDAGQRLLLAADSPSGTWGTEHLWALAGDAGEYRIELQGTNGAGSYVLRYLAQRPPAAEDRLRAEAALAEGEGDRIRITGERKDLPAALARYQKALALWRRLGDRERQAVVLVRMGQARGRLGERDQQIRDYEEALRALRNLGRTSQEIYALLELGTARRESAAPEAALAAFEEALRLAREIRDRSEEATALNNLAVLFELEGRMQESLELLGEALALYQQAGRRDWAAHVLSNMGFSHILMGQLDEAWEVLGQALRLHQDTGDQHGMTVALLHLGWIDYLREDPAAALAQYARALELSRAAENLVDETGALDRQGTAYLALGEVDRALASYLRAREISRQLDRPLAAAHVEANLGRLYLRQGDFEHAGRSFESARAGFRKAGDSHGEAGTLHLGARIARRQGRLAEARRYLEEVLRIVESNRLASEDSTVRITYLSSRYRYYELYVDLLMELEGREAGRGYAAAALAAVERSRARSLLDQLTAAGLCCPPREAAPQPLDLEGIRRQLLDEETLLLAYSLGRERSFVWAVTTSSLTFRELAPAAEIEELATRLHRSLARSRQPASRMQAELAAAALSEMVLVPVVRDKVVVIADGALHLVPFGVLPKPVADGSGPPLLVEHEVVHVPSASVTAYLRRQAKRQGRGIAVLADAPFTVADPRVPATGTVPLAAPGFVNLDRLAHSRREAEQIGALVPQGTPHLEALGFAARRDLVADGGLSGYAILHFATHGLLHAEHPELSGLVLAMFDEEGRPIDGTLRVREVYQLELAADLAVLSACRTALGRRFRGEGVLGLPRAFMYAGVPRVVVSLWDVDDRATAELMQRFYRGVLGEGLRPAAALRRAQRSMLAEDRWQSPFYWAAFVLQGDWH